MKVSEAKSFFNGAAGVAAVLGISVQAVYKWGDDVPPLREYQIREIMAYRGSSDDDHEESPSAEFEASLDDKAGAA